MTADLRPIKAALAKCSDEELRAVCAATYIVPQVAPGLLAWLDTACEWELHRRGAFDYELQPPEAAIPPEEDAISIEAAAAMRAAFEHDGTPGVALFDELVALLTGEGRRQ